MLLIIKENFTEIKYKFNNLSKANLNLGVHHLMQLNLTDAVIRFKLIDKLIDPSNEQANYWLGWSYFLKNNNDKALYHLNRAGKEDNIGLQAFIVDYANYSEVPADIWQQYMDIIAKKWSKINIIEDKEIHLSSLFAQCVLRNIDDLPNDYHIFEMGTNIGVIGIELRKRFPGNFTLSGIEASKNMLSTTEQLTYSDKYVYDHLICDSIQNFTDNDLSAQLLRKKANIVISFLGFGFTKKLEQYLDFIFSILEYNGYIAFCFAAESATSYSMKKKQFVFDKNTIDIFLATKKLVLLEFKEVKLGINNKYYIYILKKL